MEAEEARRLRDEARRLADAAKIFMRVPKHNTTRENNVHDKMGYGSSSVAQRQ
jgi:hypothetical protein